MTDVSGLTLQKKATSNFPPEWSLTSPVHLKPKDHNLLSVLEDPHEKHFRVTEAFLCKILIITIIIIIYNNY